MERPLEAKAPPVCSVIDPKRNPPPSNMLRGIFYRLAELRRMGSPVLSVNHLGPIIRRLHKVQAYARTFSSRDPKITEEAVAGHIINYLLSLGALIRTNDDTRTYVFDEERFEQVIRAAQRHEMPPPMLMSRQERLCVLLGLPLPTSPVEKLEKAQADGSTTATEPVAPVEAPPAPPVAAVTLREHVIGAVLKLVNGRAEKYPQYTRLAEVIATLAQKAKADERGEIDTTLLDLLTLIFALIAQIENEALEVATELERGLAKPPSATGETPASPETAPKKPDDDVGAELRHIREMLEPLQEHFQSLRDAQADAETDLETIREEILNQNLRERIRFCREEDRPKVEAAIARAEAKATEINHYIEGLVKLRQPIEERVSILTRRLAIIDQLQQPLPADELPTVDLPEAPEIDEDALRDWESIKVPPTTSPKGVTPPARKTSRRRKSKRKTPAPVGDILTVDAVGLSRDEKLILATFALMGQRSSLRVANILWRLGYLKAASDRAVVFSTCQKFGGADADPRYLQYRGPFMGKPTYRLVPGFAIPWVDEFFPGTKADELRAAFVFTGKKAKKK